MIHYGPMERPRALFDVYNCKVVIRMLLVLVGVYARARHLPALTSYYSKQTNYMGIFTVSVCVCVCSRAHN